MNNIKISDDLRSRYNTISKIVEHCQNSLSKYPDGRLRIKRQNGSVYYCHVSSGKDSGTYIKADDPLVRQLAQKEYLESTLRLALMEQKLLEKIIGRYPTSLAEDLYGSYSDERKALINPIVLPDDEYVQTWLNKPYRHKEISNDIPVYLTIKGERVRSKSEQIIADHLTAKGIPYKYEFPLNFGDFVLHPDFTILRLSDRKVIYYEHLGRMDDPGYAEDNVRKLTVYSLNGLILGDNLFTTLETRKQPLDVRVLDNLIEKKFR